MLQKIEEYEFTTHKIRELEVLRNIHSNIRIRTSYQYANFHFKYSIDKIQFHNSNLIFHFIHILVFPVTFSWHVIIVLNYGI